MTAPNGANGANERCLGRFTEWYRRTPVAFEFWEVLVTDRRMIGCRVGESFKSMLLRADMGERGREAIADLSPDKLVTSDRQLITVPTESLRRVHLQRGGLARRAVLTIEWDPINGEDSSPLELYNTRRGDPQVGLVETLADDDRLSHLTVSIDEPCFALF